MSSSASPSKEGMIFPTREEFLESCKRQTALSLPKPIINYILKNPPSAKFYQKIIQCSKEFYLENPILVFPTLEYKVECGGDEGWQYCTKKKCSYFCDHKVFEMEELQAKIWITEDLTILDTFTNGIQELLPKLYKCDATRFYWVGVDIGCSDLKRISSSVKDCYMKYCSVNNDESGEIVPLEELVEIFSNAKDFSTERSHNDGVNNYKKLVDACSAIKNIGFYNLDDEFDVDTFANLLEETNCPSHIRYMKESDEQLSSWNNGYSDSSDEEEDDDMSEFDYDMNDDNSDMDDNDGMSDDDEDDVEMDEDSTDDE